MSHIRALGAVVVLLALIAASFAHFWTYLTRGMSPPESTQMLNKMELNGVPDFTAKDLSGNTVELANLKGRIVVINFWASWCGPCVKEFPSLKRLVEKRPGQITILAVSNDNSADDLNSFLNAFGERPKDFQVIWDKDRRISELYGTQVLPESYIVGSDQHLIRKVAGVDEWDAPMALQFFDELLARPH